MLSAVGILLILAHEGLAQTQREVILPLDPSTPIIVLRYSGGFCCAPVSPALVVRSDGSLTAAEASMPFEDRIPPSELQELLHWIIDDQRFFEFDSATTKAAIAFQPGQCNVTIDDASTVTIQIRTREREKNESFYAPGFYAQFHPSVQPLTRFAAIETRLYALVKQAMAGGTEGLEAALKEANEFVRTHPEFPALTRENYVETSYTPPRRQKVVRFVRELGGDQASITVRYGVNRTPEVTGEILAKEPDLLDYLRNIARNKGTGC